ncbi:hypothetical protein ABR32_02775 [Enterobacter cloacae subsp. dissolvens]|nr:hypothetical protein ABR32_02775 [Enterobacter cloacae subsp. dissolvens]
MVHSRVSEHIHQRARSAGFFIPRTKDQRTDTAVHHRAGTHDARFKRDVQRGVEQTVVLQYQPPLTKCHDFCVSGRIVAANRAVPPFANHLIVMDKHGPHGHFPLVPGAPGKR